MRDLLVLATILLSSIFVSPQIDSTAATRQGKDEALLLQRERQLCDAFKDQDSVALKGILSENFVFTDENGQVASKNEYVAAVMNDIRVKSYQLEDLAVRVYGTTGIVTGRWTGELTVNGAKADGSFRFTDTFIKLSDNRWVAVASQDTRISTSKS